MNGVCIDDFEPGALLLSSRMMYIIIFVDNIDEHGYVNYRLMEMGNSSKIISSWNHPGHVFAGFEMVNCMRVS